MLITLQPNWGRIEINFRVDAGHPSPTTSLAQLGKRHAQISIISTVIDS